MPVFAVISQGGKQYRVTENDRILVESFDKKEGERVDLKDVLMLCDMGTVTLGSPYVSGASVRALVVRQLKGPKIDALLFKCRKRARRRFGHRQRYTELLIEKIDAGGKPSPRKTARRRSQKQKASTAASKETPQGGV